MDKAEEVKNKIKQALQVVSVDHYGIPDEQIKVIADELSKQICALFEPQPDKSQKEGNNCDKDLLMSEEEIEQTLKQIPYLPYRIYLPYAFRALIQAQISKCQSHYQGYKSPEEVQDLKSVIRELMDAMKKYEIDVDVDPPNSHRQMMERAELALKEGGK